MTIWARKCWPLPHQFHHYQIPTFGYLHSITKTNQYLTEVVKKLKTFTIHSFLKILGYFFYQNLLILGSPPPPYYDQQLPLNPAAPSAPSATRPTSPTIATLPKPGNRKCERDNCVTCDLLINGTSFRSTMTGKEYKFMPSVGCETTNIIYLVSKAQCGNL